MTYKEHADEAMRHQARVTTVGDRDLVAALVHALLAIASAIHEGLDNKK
jgi:hypothetical protein